MPTTSIARETALLRVVAKFSSLAADVTEMRRELAEAATERQLILGALQALEGKLSEMVPRVEPVESDDVG